MKIKVLVEFEVEVETIDGDDELTEAVAKEAAEQAVSHNLTLSRTGVYVSESAVQHVDGFGECRVWVRSSE